MTANLNIESIKEKLRQTVDRNYQLFPTSDPLRDKEEIRLWVLASEYCVAEDELYVYDTQIKIRSVEEVLNEINKEITRVDGECRKCAELANLRNNDLYSYNCNLFLFSNRLHGLQIIRDEIVKANNDQVWVNSVVEELSTSNQEISLRITSGDSETNDKIIEEHLRFFTGSFKGKSKIMNDEEHKKLIQYVKMLVDEKNVPEINQPFNKLCLTTEFIRMTFSRLYDAIYKERKKDRAWVTFLHTVFAQFSTFDEETTFTKFRSYTKNFDQDRERIVLK